MSGDETNGHCFKNRTSPKATAAISREAYTIMIIESFRFEDEISFEVFAPILEKYSTRKALLYHFSPEKLMRLCLA